MIKLLHLNFCHFYGVFMGPGWGYYPESFPIKLQVSLKLEFLSLDLKADVSTMPENHSAHNYKNVQVFTSYMITYPVHHESFYSTTTMWSVLINT